MTSSANPLSANDLVLLRHDNSGVATLTLNRPTQYNALSEQMLTELQNALDAIAEDSTIRVLVLAGSGTAFCAGHDLKQMRAKPDKTYYQQLFRQCSKMMLSIIELPQPVIARVHGLATAAGCQLVANCDLAIASTDARFAVSGVNLGLFCSTPGVALSRNVSRKRALEMLLTGEFIDAQTAVEYGLVNRSVKPDDLDNTVYELAHVI
ncbi:MAG: enoyl-CoA hydratase, partial [Gammaproteobacteria bacterium]|nr:enoyl-CoA hydratase [Gammaproteobacteria bacterium]